MKKTAIAVALSIPLFLASCSPADLTKVYGDIQAKAAKLCGFVPAIPMIGQIVGAFFPGVALGAEAVTAVATKACDLAKNKKQGVVEDKVVVDGWDVSGQ